MKQFGKVLASLSVVALGCLFLSTSSHAGSSYGFSIGYNSGGCSPRYSASYGYRYGGCAPVYYGGAYCAPSYGIRPATVYYYAPPAVYYRPTYYYSGGHCYRY